MTRVLVVDDSPLMRRLLGDLFAGAGDFEVAFARDGGEALDAIPTFRPDVITLDVQMAPMDGLTCLDRIMVEHPTPVVMVSSLTTEGADETLQALDLGAVDIVAKPTGAVSLKMDEVGPAIVEKVRAAAQVSLPKARRLAERLRQRPGAPRSFSPRRPASTPTARRDKGPAQTGPVEGLVLIGASTGGPPALDAVLSALPARFRWTVLVAQHMPSAFTGPLAQRLDRLCALPVSEVTRATALRPGHVYIGRGDADLIVTARGGGLTAMAAPSSAEFRWHPSVDRLVRSAMGAMAPERMVGVLLTGMGDDGAAAMAELRKAGGRTIAEAEETAVVWGMPGALVRAGGAETVAEIDKVADAVRAMAVAR